MFGDVLCAGQPFAAAFPSLLEDSPLSTVAGSLFEDEMMDAVMEPHLVCGHRARVRPRPRYCPYTCVVTRPWRPTRQHFVILPRMADDSAGSRDRLCGQGDPARCHDRKEKKKASLPTRSRTPSSHSVSSEGCTDSRKKEAYPCSVKKQSPPDGSRDSESEGKTSKESPWQFSVDVKGCDEVRATTEGGMLMVEGRGSSDTSRQMMRYITSLPRHVSHDSLTASLTNGRLTVTQKAAAQLQGQARTLPIDVQGEASPQPEPEQQQQRQEQQQSTATEGGKEKNISSANTQEEAS